jgi:hypothetical protein
VYFSAHGGQHGVQLLQNGTLFVLNSRDPNYVKGNSKRINVEDINLTKTKLVVYSSCEGAANVDKSGTNISKSTYVSGAKCVIGWKKDIGDDVVIWMNVFRGHLEAGATIKAALDYANAARALYDDPNAITSAVIYGDGTQKLKLN